jgi:hypothetical protein
LTPTLDWGNAFGPATLAANPVDLTLGPKTTNFGGINVGVTVGPDFVSGAKDTVSRFFTRTDNEFFVLQNGAWVIANTASGALKADFTYAGHFYAPGIGPPPQAGNGAHLLEMYNNHVFGTGSYVITFDKPIQAAGLLVSVQGSEANTAFDATIKAYDRNSNLLSTYTINTAGVGGLCTSLVEQLAGQGHPTACNDAPFIGIRAPSSLSSEQIYSIVISATTGSSPDSVLIGSLQLEESAPEPSVVFLCGAGLLLLGVLRRKQSFAGGSKK